MNPYMFVVKGIPLPENRNYSIVAGAKIHILVLSDNIESAKKQATTYIENLLWKPQVFEHEFEIPKEQIPSLHVDEANLYHKAIRYGIAADFLAWPKNQGDSSDPVIIGCP